MNASILIGLIFLASIAGNWWQMTTIRGLREQIGQVRAEKKIASDAASACSAGVDQLRAKSEQQAKAAEKAMAEARKTATAAGRRADVERTRTPAVPGNACASAEVESRDWLAKRRAQ